MFRETIVLAVICQLTSAFRMFPSDTTVSGVTGLKKLTTASTIFSEKLYKELAVSQPNVVISPLSVHTSLSMALLGARGTTAQELKTVLHLNDVSSPHVLHSQLIHSLNSVQMVKLLLANGMFVKSGFTLKPDFKQSVISKYDATAEVLNMQNPGGPETLINNWVADKTENKITNIMKPGSIDSNTAMILLNTIFFNGTWAKPFTYSMTTKSNFYKTEGSQVQVDLMHLVDVFPIKQNVIPGVDVVSIPFIDSRFSLIVALPKSKTGINSLESHITNNVGSLNVLFQGFENKTVDLWLPKFTLTATIDLKNPLTNLGIRNAFIRGADFSGISDSPIFISKILQKAKIEVTEVGTVATAATMSQMSHYSAIHHTEEPVVFKADHPFMFFLHDSVTGAILFQGKLVDPLMTEVNI